MTSTSLIRLFTSAGVAFMIPVAGALMMLNYGMFDHFLRVIGKEILFTGIRVAIAGAPNPKSFDITALRADIAASEFVRPLRVSRAYLASVRANEVLIQRVGLLRYHFVLASPIETQKYLVFEIFSAKLLWLFHASTGFMWLLLLSFSWTLRRRGRKEESLKENLMKDALESWLRQGELSSFINERFPRLVEWWERRQAEIDHQTRILHDIKVPLAALQNGGAPDVQRSVRAIQTLMSAPAHPAVDGDFDVNDAIRAAILGVEAVSSRVKIGHRDLLPRAPRLRGSAAEFQRHLANLLMNAIEASREPLGVSSIIVEVEAVETAEGLNVAVRDWGRGIPAKVLHRLGKKGFTFGKAWGSGYGLHFCRQWIEAPGGRLLIRSEEGKGTEAVLAFPWSMVKHEGEKVFAGIVKSGEMLIIFDDDPLCRDVYRMLFQVRGISSSRISWASSPEELEEKISALKGERFWVIADYYFDGLKRTGPEILKARGLGHRSLLISNVDVNEDIEARLSALGLPFLAKGTLAEGSGSARGQHDEPEQGVPADYEEQHPAGAV